jgi:pimeloyl-ACP methyl ester carboxylesterase
MAQNAGAVSTNPLRDAKILHEAGVKSTVGGFMPHAMVNGVKLHYHEAGRGLPVVLLHGFPLDHRIWHKQWHDLASVCRVIAPDMRGFGLSHDSSSYTIDSLAEDIYLLLTQLHALPCVVGGLSMGGYVSLAYARNYASTLRGLMLICTRAADDSPQERANRDAMIETARTQGSAAVAQKMLPKMFAGGKTDEPADLVREVTSMMELCPVTTIEHALTAMRDRVDYRPTLGKIVAPTLIISGGSDVLIPAESADVMHKGIPGSQLEVIPGAGHLAPMEQPQAVSRAILKFLHTLGG